MQSDKSKRSGVAHALSNVKISRDESVWEVEVKAEIPADLLSTYRAQALKEIQKDAKLDGFRPGHAPLERIVEIYGEHTILKHAIERAISHELPKLLAVEKFLIVDSPRVTTESASLDKPVAFTASAPLAPQVTLPDYKKIAAEQNAKKEEISISDEEHREVLTHLRRERARIDNIEAGKEPKVALDESRALKEEELPELDETFVKSLGIESIEKFSETVRANIKTEKELRAREKRRAGILDDLVKESSVQYPAILRGYELDDMEARMKSDLESMGQTFESYLAHLKKTREQVRDDWKEAADKRAKVRLILSEIARKENIEPSQEHLEKEIAHAREHAPNADPAALRAHIAHALRNEAVLEFLEAQK